MRPTIPSLELQRIIRTLAMQLHQNPVPGEYARGYCDALAGVFSLTGVNDGHLQRVAMAAHAELVPAGYEIEVRP